MQRSLRQLFTCLVSLTPLLAACELDLGLDGVATAIGCAFDFSDHFNVDIQSDQGALDAILLDCGDVTDCSERRTVLRGLTLELALEVPAGIDADDIHVESSDTDVMVLDAFEPTHDGCDELWYQVGQITFVGEGTASLVAFADDEEIGRFTWVSSNAATIEIDVDRAGEDLPRADSYVLDQAGLTLRSVVRNAEGERLLTGGRDEWWVEDTGVAALPFSTDLASASGHGQPLYAVAAGVTRVHLVVWNLRTSIEVQVLANGDAAVDAAAELDAQLDGDDAGVSP